MANSGPFPHAIFDRAHQRATRQLVVRVERERRDVHLMRRVDDGGLVRLHRLQNLVRPGHDEIAPENEIRAANAGPNGVDVVRRFGNPDMARHCAALLRKARHIDGAETFAIEIRSLTEHRRNGDDTGTADARHDDRVGVIDGRLLRLRQRCKRRRQRIGVRRLRLRHRLHARAMHRHEARAEAVDAREILVARRLVDHALGAKRGFERRHGNAVRLLRAIAAAFANGRIDEGALIGIREQTALAAAALLGRTGLVIDQNRDAFDLRQLHLHRLQIAPVMDRHA